MFASRRAALGGDVFRDEYSLEFDGTDDYLDAGNDSSIQVGTLDFSICAWIKEGADGANVVIIAYGRDTDPRWFFRIDSSNKLEMFSDDGTGTSLISASTITGTDWNHVALSWDRDSATGAKLYINGVLDAERDGTPEQGTLTNASYGMLIGARRTTGTTVAQFWDGKISDIALYIGIALTASQVRTIYNGREPYNHREGVSSGSLVGWWRMGDGALDYKVYSGFVADESTLTATAIGPEVMENGDIDSDVPTLADDAINNVRCTSARSTTLKHSGTHSFKVTHDGSSTNANFYTRFDDGLTNTKTYKTSVWVYLPDSVTINQILLVQKLNNSEVFFETTTVTDAWVQLTATFTVDTTGGFFYMAVMGKNTSGNAGTSDFYYWDDMTVKEVTGNVGVMVNFDGSDFSGDTP